MAADWITDINKILDEFGQAIVVRTVVQTFSGTQYDDSYIAASGTGWSGNAVVIPVASDKGGTDFKLIELGRIEFNDRKLLVAGSMALSELNWVDIGTSGNTFSVVQVLPHAVAGSVVFNTAYARKLTGATL